MSISIGFGLGLRNYTETGIIFGNLKESQHSVVSERKGEELGTAAVVSKPSLRSGRGASRGSGPQAPEKIFGFRWQNFLFLCFFLGFFGFLGQGGP